ncbi:MAG: hypothetical protein M0021_16265 [Clostridia bacterium]|nr:hypothetical protein [Clostridia bacterium]
MAYEQAGGAVGYFFGRLDTPDELTIAFLAEREEVVHGFASLLSEIGPDNLRVCFEIQPSGAVGIIVEDKRDPGNFQDKRLRTVPMITRFLMDFEEDKKLILTVGDLDLNMDYDRLRLEIKEIEVICSKYLH